MQLATLFGRSISRRRLRATLGASIAGLTLIAGSLALSPSAEAHQGACGRIQVETREHGSTVSVYTVSEPDYTAKMHGLIDQNGENGSWTVGAGELGWVGYTVTYSCLP